MNGTQYRDLGLQELGVRQLSIPKRCGCGALTWLESKKHNKVTCLECIISEYKESQGKPLRLFVAAAALLLMCCVGCQSAPSKVTVQACVAGQTFNVQVMR